MHAHRPTVRPADRSVPRVMRIPPTPSAMMTRTDDIRRILPILSILRKLLSTIPIASTSPASTRTIAYLLASCLARATSMLAMSPRFLELCRERHDLLLCCGRGVDDPGHPAVAHDENPVRQAEQLGHLGGDHEDRLSAPRELRDQQIDLVLGADIDARSE